MENTMQIENIGLDLGAVWRAAGDPASARKAARKAATSHAL
jgi:hypothetical protein